MQSQREKTCSSLNQMERGKLCRHEWRIEILPILLSSAKPHVVFGDVREVFGSVPIQQFCLRIPEYPTKIERTIAIAHHLFWQAPSLYQVPPRLASLKA